MKSSNLMLTLLVFAFFSCNKEAAEVSIPSDINLLGNWVMTASLADEPLLDINQDGINSRNILEELPCRKIELHLHSDSTFTQIDNSWAHNSHNGGIACTSSSSTYGNWTFDAMANMLILEFSIDGSSWEHEVPIELSDNQLSCRLGTALFDSNYNEDQVWVYGRIIMERQ